jgi:hypothetical protein
VVDVRDDGEIADEVHMGRIVVKRKGTPQGAPFRSAGILPVSVLAHHWGLTITHWDC